MALNISVMVIIFVNCIIFSCGGNILMNVGPTHDGRILPVFEERLRDIGAWLKINGEAVYLASPWKHQSDDTTTGVWYIARPDLKAVYAFFTKWPRGNSITLANMEASSQTVIKLLGYEGSEEFTWAKSPSGGIVIKMPVIPFYDMPSKWLWTLKFSDIV